jgi:penicillin amidase
MRDVEREVWLTHHGPVVERTESGHILSFRWLEHAPTDDVLADLKMARAQNLSEFMAALDLFVSPAQNFVYADVEGAIFYRGQGRIPRRAPRACLPLRGEDEGDAWQEFIPSVELPSLNAPPAGFICTANNWPAPASYPHYITAGHALGLRAWRLHERLAALERVSMEDLKELQTDLLSGEVRHLLPHLLRAAQDDEDLAEFVRPLQEWDGQMRRDAVAPTIFYTWLRFLAEGVTLSHLPPDLRDFVRWFNVPMIRILIASLNGTARHDWFEGRNPHAAARQALWCAEKHLNDTLGLNPEMWAWGRVHELALEHPLGGAYDRGRYPCDGGIASPSPAAFAIIGDDRTVRNGPSMRMVVELKEGRVHAECVIPGGQRADTRDGDPDDQLPLWREQRFRPMRFYPDEIEAAAWEVLVLRPAATAGARGR